MHPKLTLISHHLCPYVQRAAFVLAEKGLEHERVYIDLADKPGWFRALSPLGKTPVLQVGGTVLFESQVIAEYLDEAFAPRLHPDDILERARHRAWIEYASTTLGDIAALYNADTAGFETKRRSLDERLARVEREVAGPWFAGERFHMIDGVWGTVFRYFDAIERLADFESLALPRIAAWRAGIFQRRSVIEAAPADYETRLLAFLRGRATRLGDLAREYAEDLPVLAA